VLSGGSDGCIKLPGIQQMLSLSKSVQITRQKKAMMLCSKHYSPEKAFMA